MSDETEPQLTEDAVREIEKRIDSFPLSPFQARALVRDWRAMRAQVTKFSELADERHDLLSAERRENGELRFQRAQLSGRVEQLRQCVVDIGKENAALREQLAETERERNAYRGQIVSLNTQLAQVTSERDEALIRVKALSDDADVKKGYL